MPIREEFRQYYGAAWRKLRATIIAIRGPRCEDCGRVCLRYLNLTHDLRDPRTKFVTLRCPSCHGKYDDKHSHALARRTRAAKVGQLWLSEEMERAAENDLQLEMFTDQ